MQARKLAAAVSAINRGSFGLTPPCGKVQPDLTRLDLSSSALLHSWGCFTRCHAQPGLESCASQAHGRTRQAEVANPAHLNSSAKPGCKSTLRLCARCNVRTIRVLHDCSCCEQVHSASNQLPPCRTRPRTRMRSRQAIGRLEHNAATTTALSSLDHRARFTSSCRRLCASVLVPTFVRACDSKHARLRVCWPARPCPCRQGNLCAPSDTHECVSSPALPCGRSLGHVLLCGAVVLPLAWPR